MCVFVCTPDKYSKTQGESVLYICLKVKKIQYYLSKSTYIFKVNIVVWIGSNVHLPVLLWCLNNLLLIKYLYSLTQKYKIRNVSNKGGVFWKSEWVSESVSVRGLRLLPRDILQFNPKQTQAARKVFRCSLFFFFLFCFG